MINSKNLSSLYLNDNGDSLVVIDQTQLPHNFTKIELGSCEEVIEAIKKMIVRGAPLIGIAGAYGLMFALQKDPSDQSLEQAFQKLNNTRPTAINLRWSLQRIFEKVKPFSEKQRANIARIEADLMAQEDFEICESIGNNGLKLIRELKANRPSKFQSKPINLLTHCNAGYLATTAWGTALAPIYKAHMAGLNIHVWVDETRPRNQGASLTSFELDRLEVPYTLIVDNAGGYLMQNGQVDAVFVGADRITKAGDVCNKIGTYLKALAAYDNNLPFYVAAPLSTIDFSIEDGVSEIPIEIRSAKEVTHVSGLVENKFLKNYITSVMISPDGCKGYNPAFDITPSRLISGLITEKGLLKCCPEDLKKIAQNI